MQAIRYLALDHGALAELQPQSYVTTLVHTCSKMRVQDKQVWMSLGSYIAQRYEFFDLRSLSNILYSFMYAFAKPAARTGNLTKDGKGSISSADSLTMVAHFDELFDELELPLIVKLDSEGSVDS